MKQINDFAGRFGASLSFDPRLIIEKQNRYFLLSQSLKQIVTGDFYFAGVYLGKVKRKTFFPSFPLLTMISKDKESNRLIVDEKTEWLFICGRDVFKQGIIKIMGAKRKGDCTLVLNKHGECLGFGRILCGLTERCDKRAVIVKNISDVGDFLRRERQTH